MKKTINLLIFRLKIFKSKQLNKKHAATVNSEKFENFFINFINY